MRHWIPSRFWSHCVVLFTLFFFGLSGTLEFGNPFAQFVSLDLLFGRRMSFSVLERKLLFQRTVPSKALGAVVVVSHVAHNFANSRVVLLVRCVQQSPGAVS